ncbi:hypothetical protein PROFUN_09789 [Planoprotostelium fungivorum]|uniref:Uncharacterized protein n=1 Tax=Planoprotostelium fungivorum TaxID=1890364 RepID=A0A2P6NGN7_9EUKA|nr:hypothetical protein PROFUN_09789 [Planoprotostelium fungivorum]
MGLTGLILDTVAISSAFAGLRRATGYSIQEKIVPKINNVTARTSLNAFFNVGEFIVDKGIKAINSTSKKQ